MDPVLRVGVTGKVRANEAAGQGTIEWDFIVIGSAAAALVAALKVSSGGKSVLIVEKSNLVGGTSAMSGAGMSIRTDSATSSHYITKPP